MLIRRNIVNGDLAYFTTWCPAGTSIQTLVSVEGHRWAIEDSFETAKNEFGLDHNESRSWHGWHRHVSLVMFAFAMMAAIQHQANKPAPKKTKSSATPRHPRLHLKNEFNPPTSSHGRSGGGLIKPQHKKLNHKNHNCNARTVSINLPCGVVVSHHSSARERGFCLVVRNLLSFVLANRWRLRCSRS